MEIPPFDGNSPKWHSFHDTFRSLVHENIDIPLVQKFHLLKNSLTDEATSVIASLNATSENYIVAWQLLENKYDQPRHVIHSHVQALLDIPEISRDSSTTIRGLSEKAQIHVNALKTLNRSSLYKDAFLVHIITRKLDKSTRKSRERTLENKEIPTFSRSLELLNKRARG